jgi:hypothetical protein
MVTMCRTETMTRFKHDQELHFKVKARRNRLLGMWAAERLGLSGAAAEAYASEVVDDRPVAAMELGVDKVLADLTAKGLACTAAQVQFELDHLAEHAKQQIMQK